MPTLRPRPLVLIILDGWGISFVEKGNAIHNAPTPTMDAFARYFPAAAIQAAGIAVGLPWGEVGNSETGHRNIGAGQVQYQPLPMIDKAIEDDSFFNNQALVAAIQHVKRFGSQLHLMGLVSPGGVHSHMNHLFALLELCHRQHLRDNVYIHMFTDGRDSPPQSALAYLTELESAIGKSGVGKIASVTGRFYAMDRNQNWDRVKATVSMLTGGRRPAGAPTARQAIEQAYRQALNDEMIPPTAVTRGGGPITKIGDNDAVVFFNFRPDRARQLTQAFTQPSSVGFPAPLLTNLYFVTLWQYDVNLTAPFAFSDVKGQWPLARVISEAGLTQLHIAETEKYAHVTYYLNVGHEQPFPGEQRALIRSASVKDFAKTPRMAAGAITDRVVQAIQDGSFDVYVVNYANADMVGHTGNYQAAVAACAFVDTCLGRIAKATLSAGAMLITADHGNAEEMINPQTGQEEHDHSSNPVPLYFVAAALQRTTPKTNEELSSIFSNPIGVLADVAPTVLEILHLPRPPTMTGISLLSSLR